MTPNDQRFSREGADVWPPTGERGRAPAGAGPDVHAVFCSKSSGRLVLGAASGAEPESPDVFANAPKFLGSVTKTGDK